MKIINKTLMAICFAICLCSLVSCEKETDNNTKTKHYGYNDNDNDFWEIIVSNNDKTIDIEWKQ